MWGERRRSCGVPPWLLRASTRPSCSDRLSSALGVRADRTAAIMKPTGHSILISGREFRHVIFDRYAGDFGARSHSVPSGRRIDSDLLL